MKSRDKEPLLGTLTRSYILYVPFICVLNAGICGAYYGVSTIIDYYLLTLGFSKEVANSASSMFFFLTYLFALVGGICADAFLGAFRVLCIGTMTMLLGSMTLTFSELLRRYDEAIHLPLSMVGLVLFYLGNGFMKPCLSAFLGDQFSESEGEERSKWFSWFYMTIQIGSLGFSIGTPITIQSHVLPPYVTFLIVMAPLLLAFSIFFIPHQEYRKKSPAGNVFATFVKILWAGCWGKRDTFQSHWLDKAKTKYENNQVEDAKIACKVLLIMLPLPFFWMIFFQMYSLWLEPARQMYRTFGTWELPAEETSALNGLLDIFLIPLFESVIYPILSRPGITRYFNFTPLKRMAAGHLFTIAALCVAGYVTKRINDLGPGQVHIAWIIPQYVLISMAEILLSITGLELAFTEAPPSMKGTITAVFQCTTAFGNALISALAFITLDLWIKDFALAAIVGVVFIVFTLISYNYEYTNQQKPIMHNIQDE